MKKGISFRSVYYPDVFDGESPSIDLLHKILRNYSLDSVLTAVATVSFVRGAANLAAERGTQKPVWRGLVRTLFRQREVRKKIGDDAPQLLARPVLLFVAREALRVCPDAGEKLAGDVLGEELGRLFFVAADLLFPKTTELEGALASHVAQNQFVGTGIKNRIVRSLKITESLSRIFEGRYGATTNSKFEETVGLSILDFQNICLSVFMRFTILAEQLVEESTQHIDLESLAECVIASPLPESGISPLKMQSFIHALSHVTSAARQGALSCSNPFDFTLFRERPLLKLGNGDAVVVDPGFLLDQIDKGPFFRLVNVADKKQRDALFSLWGAAFEDFTSWVLAEHIGHSGIHTSPRFKTNNENEEICDLAICSPATAVLIECKGCYFSVEALDSLNPARLGAAIIEKLEGDEDTPKGATQLANAVRRLYTLNTEDDTAHADIRNASTVYPVLVVRDEIADTFLMNKRLNQAFVSALGSSEKRTTIRPMVCLSVGVLQNILELLKRNTLAELLEMRIKADPELAVPAGLVFSQMLPGYGEPSAKISDIFANRCRQVGLRIASGPRYATVRSAAGMLV
jgi:hypothetical protein